MSWFGNSELLMHVSPGNCSIDEISTKVYFASGVSFNIRSSVHTEMVVSAVALISYKWDSLEYTLLDSFTLKSFIS